MIDLELIIAVVAGAFASGFGTAILLRRVGQAHIGLAALVFIATAVDIAIAVWAIAEMPDNLLLPVSCILGWTLAALAAIDALIYRLPDFLTLPLIAVGLGATLLFPQPAILDHIIGAAAGFAVFALIGELYRRLRGRDGMGLGDAKLAAAGGAWLGWQALPSFVLVASALGIFWIVVRYFNRGEESLQERIAFGLPLCISFWFTWLYGAVAF